MKFSKKQIFLLMTDICLILIAFTLSFVLRFEGALPNNFFENYGLLLVALTAIKVTLLIFHNLYKKVWRYANLYELLSLSKGLTVSTALFIVYIYFFRRAFPRSVIILDWLISFIALGGIRVLLRMWVEYKRTHKTGKNPKNVLIVGAGDAGEMVLKEYRKHEELNTNIVGFIDDNPAKVNLEIHDVKVLGNRERIPNVLEKHDVDEVIIAIPSASGTDVREIHKLCNRGDLTVRILPGVFEIINGDVNLNQIREVQVEDLLGREPVDLDMDEIKEFLTSKNVLITGGGGSIGSELCRQVARFSPEKLIILDISENNIYNIELELKKRYPDTDIIPVIGSIRDISKLRNVFKEHRPDVVFHAAAHKHVPLMEHNPEEAVKNNIFGTRNVAVTSDEFGVDRFVMISTDKAVNPTNVMGATKRVAEMIIQDINKKSDTKFVAVRFGNVLGSRGSVIPLFKEQIAKGGPVTVTHKNITRYFMTIPEASQLVMQAGSLGKDGEVFVLDMGEPVKIIDLARDLIELSGLTVGDDIGIDIIGLRPGEKLYEELLSDKENTVATKHERILIAQLDDIDSKLLHKCLKQMAQMINSSLSNYLVKVLVKLVATYKPANLHEIDKENEKDIV